MDDRNSRVGDPEKGRYFLRKKKDPSVIWHLIDPKESKYGYVPSPIEYSVHGLRVYTSIICMIGKPLKCFPSFQAAFL